MAHFSPMEKQSHPRHQRPSKLPRFLFGAPYYPEHWTTEDMQDDPERMAAAGVNVVRMAEFAWDRMEPRSGEFDFSLFDETIARLGERDIDTILCTPTATPPRWLTVQHEDWMRVDANGRRMVHGSRQQCCTNNAAFRLESERITRAMAEHFARNARVIGWQTDNEFYCHFSECYCDACVTGFREWLRKKYSTIGALNRAWGAAFWAQTYDDFDQVELPQVDRPAAPNPGHHLDHLRYLADSLCDFQRGQVKILREAQPQWWITHNGSFAHVNDWKLAEDLDFYGIDVYPGFSGEQPRNFHWGALKNEEARAASGTFIVPEQQGGAGGQRSFLLETPPPGQMRLWAYQSISHGADGMLHFRWRTCRFGAEIYWNGILDHDNVPRRRYREFAQEGEELKRIGDKILGTTLLVRAALLVECDQEEAYTTMQLGLPRPLHQRTIAYREMLARHLPVGIVDAADSLDGLDLVVLSSFALMDESLAARLRAFVERGGVLIALARTATRNRDNQVLSQTPPGLLTGLFGVTVEEFGKLDSLSLQFTTPNGIVLPAGAAYEVLQPGRAETLAEWNATPDGSPHAAPGEAAVTLNRVGKGAAIYVGTYFSEENTPALLDLILQHVPLSPLAEADECVEVTCRQSPERKLFFVLNHYPVEKSVSGLPSGVELLSQETCTGELRLPAFGVAIVEVLP
jgi:beta-galactosidase